MNEKGIVTNSSGRNKRGRERLTCTHVAVTSVFAVGLDTLEDTSVHLGPLSDTGRAGEGCVAVDGEKRGTDRER